MRKANLYAVMTAAAVSMAIPFRMLRKSDSSNNCCRDYYSRRDNRGGNYSRSDRG